MPEIRTLIVDDEPLPRRGPPPRRPPRAPPPPPMPETRTLIVDDEPLARRGVRQLLAGHPDLVVGGECRNGRGARRAVAALAPDLVFLDVQMPGLDGFGVLREYRGRRLPFVVFVTANSRRTRWTIW